MQKNISFRNNISCLTSFVSGSTNISRVLTPYIHRMVLVQLLEITIWSFCNDTLLFRLLLVLESVLVILLELSHMLRSDKKEMRVN